jgi:hypothetical protein
LKQRLDDSAESYATTIITLGEIMRGWMAAIRRTHDPRQQISAYTKLRQLFRFFATWHVLEWDDGKEKGASLAIEQSKEQKKK